MLALEEHCWRRGVHVAVVMTTTQTPAFARQLLLHSRLPGLPTATLSEHLLRAGGLDLTPLDVTPLGVPAGAAFNQGAVTKSRKVVLPLLQAFFAAQQPSLRPVMVRKGKRGTKSLSHGLVTAVAPLSPTEMSLLSCPSSPTAQSPLSIVALMFTCPLPTHAHAHLLTLEHQG